MTTSTGVGRELDGGCDPAIRPIGAASSPRLLDGATNLERPVFLLPSTTFICQRGDAFTFLDVPRDKYTLICGIHAAALRDLMFESDATATSSASNEALTHLASCGLLTTDPRRGKKIEVTYAAAPTSSINEIRLCEAHAGRLRRALDFGASCTLSLLRLRFRAFDSIIDTLRKGKAARRRENQSLDHVIELALFFRGVRSIFPAKYWCLFESLALIEFLARYHVFPDLVFAIRFEPWAAHCWVQYEQLLLNEDLETAHSFIPIMVV
jgi:transglutaminase superfamily protein